MALHIVFRVGNHRHRCVYLGTKSALSARRSFRINEGSREREHFKCCLTRAQELAYPIKTREVICSMRWHSMRTRECGFAMLHRPKFPSLYTWSVAAASSATGVRSNHLVPPAETFRSGRHFDATIRDFVRQHQPSMLRRHSGMVQNDRRRRASRDPFFYVGNRKYGSRIGFANKSPCSTAAVNLTICNYSWLVLCTPQMKRGFFV